MPLLTSTPGSRTASSRNRQTRTTIFVGEGQGSYGYTLVRCESHGATYNANNWNSGCEIARTPQQFCDSCRAIQPTINRAQRRSQRASARATALGLNRQFGVEFECFNMPRHIAQQWLNSTPGLAGWRVKSDCSISGANGLEVVSPPLRGEAGLAQIRTVLEWLNANGAQVNRSCGTHVHHDASDLGIAGAKRFVKAYVANQELIDWLVSPSRRSDRHAQYCGAWTASGLTALDRSNSSLYCSTRYKTVNVHSYPRYGTLEVRQHQGTLSYEKIVAWLKLGQAMMDAAKVQPEPVGRQAGVQSLLTAVNLDEDTSAFLLGRALQFGAPLTTGAAATTALEV